MPARAMHRIVIGCVLLASLLSPCAAQELPSECLRPGQTGLDGVLGDLQRGDRDLLRSRGISASAPEAHLTPRRIATRLEALRAVLPGAMLLVYARGSERLCAWLFDGRGLVAAAVSPMPFADIRRGLASLRRSLGVDPVLASRSPRRRGVEPASAVAATPDRKAGNAAIRDVSAALFPEALHDGLGRARHLVIVPVMELGTVPFAVLTPGGSAPLIERMSVTLFPSVTEFADLRPLGRWEGIRAGERALVVGNPDFSGEKEWEMPPLPGAQREALHLAGVFGTTALVGGEATAANVMASITQADYISIASHAIADAREPLDRSFIALAGSRLTAREIQSLRLRPSLAILSACQTGLGGTHEAGIIGLARAFTLAGAFGAVTSLWSVDDEATYLLMTRFAEHLKVHPPQEAIRRAMLDTRTKHPEPMFWASFAYFGHPVGELSR